MIIAVLATLIVLAVPGLTPRAGADATVPAVAAVVGSGAAPTLDPAATGVAATDPPTSGSPTPTPVQVVSTHPTPLPAVQRRLDRAFAAMAEVVGAPGLAAAVRMPDGSVWYGADGVLWPGGPSVTPDTPFAWGSITKTFVATLVLRLAAEGRIDLDQAISAWFPGWPQADRITVRMLLSHSSGIFDYFQHPTYPTRVFEDPLHAWTTDEILALTGPRAYAPGKGFNYSNTNYVLLGRILEQVTGSPLADQIHDGLLAPLGLDETVFQQAGRENGMVGAKGFWKAGRGFTEWSDGTDFRPTTSAATVAWAAGAMEGSVRDLLDWEIGLYQGDVLAPGSLAQMLDFDRKSGYGLGARTQTLQDRRGYGHGGSVRGFVSVMYRLPTEDIDVVVLANVGFADLDRVASRLVRAALAATATPEPSLSLPSTAPSVMIVP